MKIMEPETPTSKRIEKEFLTCPICFDVYKDPKCLPCLHTLCAACLQLYIESQAQFGARSRKGYSCPVCKQFTNVKNPAMPFRHWVHEVPHNFFIQNMIDTVIARINKNEQRTHKMSPNMLGAGVSGKPLAVDDPYNCDNTSSDAAVFPNMSTDCRIHTAQRTYSDLVPTASEPEREHSFQLVVAPPQQYSSGGAQNVNVGTLNSEVSRVQTTRRTPGETSCNLPLQGPPEVFGTALASTSGVVYKEIHNHIRYYQMAARNWSDYVPAQLSDICCLPKHNGVLVLDWGNRAIKFIKNIFLGRNVTTSMEVVGRPCSFALLNPDEESIVLVSLLNRNKLYFIQVPELEMIDVMDVGCCYRGITVLSRTAVLASSDNPASIDLITIDHRCKHVSTTRIYQQGRWAGGINFDICHPHYMVALSTTTFAVSDAQRKSIVIFQVDDSSESTKAVKKFTLTPPECRQIKKAGGMCYNNGYIYVVDTESHEVLRLILGATVTVETVLRRSDDVYKPSSICVGPQGEIVISNWEGIVTLFQRKA